MGRVLWVLLIVAAGIGMTMGTSRGEEVQTLAELIPASTEVTQQVFSETVQPKTFPCVLEEGVLVAEELMEYEGPYLEDGSGEPVSGIAALMLHNTGTRGISSCAIAVQQGKRTLYFCATWIPAGARVLVLSCDRSLYTRDPITDCRSIALRWEDFYSAGPAVQVTDNADGTLTVTNGSYRELRQLCLRWKPYYADGDFYLGGITRSIYIGTLEPGGATVIPREHYSADLSKVVAILSH